jgi:uncharacterized protein (DUF1778 family)
MKKPNQAVENSKRAPRSAQQKAASRLKRTIRVRMSAQFRRAIEQGAKRENVTVSQFVERAIRDVLCKIEEQQ